MTKINKRSKERLKKVMHVFYPEYKHITIKKNLDVVCSKYKYWISRLFHKKDTLEYNLLVKHFLPYKLTQLKYNNTDFLSTVVEEVTSVEMRKEDVIWYFYKEVVKVKYPHVFKEVSFASEMIHDEEYDECELSESIHFKIRREANNVNQITKQTFLTRMQCHPMYYEYMVLGAMVVMLLGYIILNHK